MHESGCGSGIAPALPLSATGQGRQDACPTPTVAVVILSYRSAGYLGPCLAALAADPDGRTAEIVVVDNASLDGSVAVARSHARRLGLPVAVIASPANRGCAGGNNVGWRATAAPVVVFLNPDAMVRAGCIAALAQPLLSDPSIGATGTKIFWPGTDLIQHAGGRVYPNGMTDHWGKMESDRGQHDIPRDCDYVTGAGFAVRRDTLEALGGFDEDYFPAYFEELDLCTRIRRRLGLRVSYRPDAVLDHHESVSLGADSPRFRRMYQRMRMIYLLKNAGFGGLARAARFERWWMTHEPTARGRRLEQLPAYAWGLGWLARRWVSGLAAQRPIK